MPALSVCRVPAWPRLSALGTEAIEPLKWVALTIMLAEHAMRYAVGELPHWLYQGGRAAFPLFVFALALGMRGLPGARLAAVTVRLLAWAVVAQAAMQVVERPPDQLNVLFTFAFGLAAAGTLGSGRPLFVQALALATILVASQWCEFGLAGVAFVTACAAVARAKEPTLAGWMACAALLAGLCIPNDSHAAWVAVPLALIVSGLPVRLPRLRGTFYWAYTLQFPVFAGIRTILT